jgi:hypothetical protein
MPSAVCTGYAEVQQGLISRQPGSLAAQTLAAARSSHPWKSRRDTGIATPWQLPLFFTSEGTIQRAPSPHPWTGRCLLKPAADASRHRSAPAATASPRVTAKRGVTSSARQIIDYFPSFQNTGRVLRRSCAAHSSEFPVGSSSEARGGLRSCRVGDRRRQTKPRLIRKSRAELFAR